MAAVSSKIRLKLLIDSKSRRVLFAEAGKDFVDFLFNLLALPVGTVVKLLTKRNMAGSLSSLYQSIENLDETYMQQNQNKDYVLNPKPVLQVAQGITFLLSDGHESAHNRNDFYTCPYYYNNGHPYVADVENVPCPRCQSKMTTKLSYVSPPAANSSTVTAVEEGAGGFVKGVVTYMIMDNLEVKPMSTISSITLLNKFNVKDVGELEEKVVDLGMDEGLKLLKASLECTTILTSVFMDT